MNIDAGTVVIEHEQAQIDGPCRDISFGPLMLPAGIAASDDPLLAVRAAACVESYRCRIMEEAKV